MFLKACVAALIAAALATPALAASEPATRPSAALTQAGAEAALQAAERLARQANDPAAIAVVDTDGLLMAFVRMDGVRPGSVELAIGKARVSEVHGNFIVNDGGATAADMIALIRKIQETAMSKRGIKLETEVQIVGQEEAIQ